LNDVILSTKFIAFLAKVLFHLKASSKNGTKANPKTIYIPELISISSELINLSCFFNSEISVTASFYKDSYVIFID
jgi:hypothetical protein